MQSENELELMRRMVEWHKNAVRTCDRCCVEKPLADFPTATGALCRNCRSKKASEHRKKADNKVRNRRNWKRDNPDKLYAYAGTRRAAKRNACPVWADRPAMARLYKEAKRLTLTTGIPHHVDHIVPLTNDLVCGLHVVANLQILTATENCAKGNYRWPDMPEVQ